VTVADERLHPHVERAALTAYQRGDTARLLAAVKAAVEEDRRMILDVVDVLANQADCAHQREPLNRILTIFGREPVDGPTLRMPDHCGLEAS
jgi:hypothetical protein